VKKTWGGNLQAPDAKPKRRRRSKGMCLEDRPVLEPNAAGIDVGAREMFVAVPPGRDENPVRVFASFTEDLERLTDWLEQCGVTTVALESTGVYWIPLFEIRTTRHPPLFGKCPPHEERTRTAHRLARMPMVTVPALGRITAGCLSTGAGRLCRADPTAAPERIGGGRQSTRAAHAQGADANESATMSSVILPG